MLSRCFSLSFCLCLLLPAGLLAQDLDDYELPSDEDIAEVVDAVQSHLSPEAQAAAETAVNRMVGQALQDGTLEDLARLRPQAEAFLNEVRQYAWAQPYADWLLARLDYLSMAGDALARARLSSPTRPGGTVPGPGVPPAKPQRTAAEIARDLEAWKTRLAARPAPARASKWVGEVKTVFTREGVPSEWVWLAEVESSWNPEAQSPVGARGLFQFMPKTAEHMGLSLDPEDERLQPEKSAEAAARYLRRLYRRFSSWPLTLAAYNAGEGRVARLLRKKEAGTFEAIADALPVETQMYVPKVLATVELREKVDPLTLPGPKPGP
ncbi:MAG: transglycosylase SLT domain-containing protein [Opitutaceae bacterium]|jgi:membrane-bound lytic murein transglycosylase D|nr:transglycosylase SLT domain-containing protein [Opitutaceae bacterium]